MIRGSSQLLFLWESGGLAIPLQHIAMSRESDSFPWTTPLKGVQRAFHVSDMGHFKSVFLSWTIIKQPFSHVEGIC